MLDSPKAFSSYVAECQAGVTSRREGNWTISVGISECSIAKGAELTFTTIERELTRLNVPHQMRQVGCGGWCWAEPFIEIQRPDGPPILYGNISQERAIILAQSIAAGETLEDWSIGVRAGAAYRGIPPLDDHPFFGSQRRLLFEECGIIDPDSIQDYVAAGGYEAFVKAITTMTPEEIIEEVKTSNIRGRGGAGFPMGIKWDGGRASQSWPKYIVVNAHEGEPNVYKDRRLIESNPHQLLEGIMIACHAIGAKVGYNYIGGEHAMAVRRFKKAVDDAYALGLLGDNVLGTGHSIHVRTRLGSGAYIAGEEMALIESLEGKQAMPRTKPPFPTVIGFMNKPTVLNNAETLSNVPHIVNKGGAWFAGIGTESSRGTKLVTMQGPSLRSGLVEIEMGMPLDRLMNHVYGGMAEGKKFLGLQTGGVSAGPLTEDMLGDYLVDFDSMKPVGGMLGSGGFVLFDHTVCPVALAHYLTEFSRYESCGKCSPCRLGCPALVEILGRIMNGQGRPGDIDLIERHSDNMIRLSLCGLGKAAPAPVLGFLKMYRGIFEQHINDKICACGTCPIDSAPPLQKNHRAATTIPLHQREILVPVSVGTTND
jgi:NADH-quinone oxidoreductase subunit F